MRSLLEVFRFFRTVPPVPPMMTGTFAVLVTVAGTAIVSAPTRATGALTPILILQVLAGASGFSPQARRGHYDMLLTGHDRRVVAVAHWVMSIMPGLASWLVLASVELVASAGSSRTLTASGTLAAVALASSLPWALTVGLPRFSGGIGWLLVASSASSIFAVPLFEPWNISRVGADTILWSAWIFLMNPLGAVGQSLSAPQAVAVAPAALVSLVVMIRAIRWVSSADVPLEATQ